MSPKNSLTKINCLLINVKSMPNPKMMHPIKAIGLANIFISSIFYSPIFKKN
ncbi:hypothetical protein LPICM17_660012 [Lactococcus piscium]|nr:hypothetical protein LPICM17_660012 [Lactococcus piscium]